MLVSGRVYQKSKSSLLTISKLQVIVWVVILYQSIFGEFSACSFDSSLGVMRKVDESMNSREEVIGGFTTSPGLVGGSCDQTRAQ